MIILIVAMAENRVIGANNRMPWHLPDDLRRFKRLTLGHPIIMGRKTHEAIGRPLPGRENLVISRDRQLVLPGCLLFHSLSAAIETFGHSSPLYVIGGAEIYREALPLADRIEMTLIHQDIPGDTYFPALPPEDWRVLERQPMPSSPASPLHGSYLTLERSRDR